MKPEGKDTLMIPGVTRSLWYTTALKVVTRVELSVMIVIAILLVSSGGCTKGAKTGERRQILLRFAHWEGIKTIRQYDFLIQKYEKEHPKVKIRAEHIPGNYFGKLLTQAAGGALPDVFYISMDRYAYFAEKGVIRPLTTFLTNDSSLDAEDFYEKVMDAVTYKEEIWMLPKGANTFVLYYNKDMFDKAEIDYPNENWTWNEFLEAAKQLTRDSNGDGRIDQFGTLLDKGTYVITTWLWGNGADFVSPDGKTVTINSPEALEALQFVLDLVRKHHVAPTTAELSDRGWRKELFRMGTIGMIIGGPHLRASYWKIRNFDWDIAPPPKGPKGRKPLLNFIGWAMSAKTKYPQEAWEFIKLVGGKEGAKNFARVGQDFPAIKDEEAIEIWSDPTKKPEHVDVYLDTLQNAQGPAGKGAWVPFIEPIFYETFDLALTGQMSIKEAMDRAAAKMQKSLDEFWLQFHAREKVPSR